MLNESAILSPSAADRARNSHRDPNGWAASAVRAILPTRATPATRSGTANGVTMTSSTRRRPPTATYGACAGTHLTAGSGRPSRRTSRSSTLTSGSECRPLRNASHARRLDTTARYLSADGSLRSLRPTDDGREPRQRPPLLPLRTPPQPPRSAKSTIRSTSTYASSPSSKRSTPGSTNCSRRIELPRPHERSSRPRRTIPPTSLESIRGSTHSPMLAGSSFNTVPRSTAGRIPPP